MGKLCVCVRMRSCGRELVVHLLNAKNRILDASDEPNGCGDSSHFWFKPFNLQNELHMQLSVWVTYDKLLIVFVVAQIWAGTGQNECWLLNLATSPNYLHVCLYQMLELFGVGGVLSSSSMSVATVWNIVLTLMAFSLIQQSYSYSY